HAAGDEEGLARLQPERLAVLELEVDPAGERVDELALADVVVPSRRLRHAASGGHHLRAHLPAGRRGDAQVAVLEELAATGDERRGGGGGVGELRDGFCRGWLRHGSLLVIDLVSRVATSCQRDQVIDSGATGRRRLEAS